MVLARVWDGWFWGSDDLLKSFMFFFQDPSVTVITIGADTVPLPTVLQDRPKASSATSPSASASVGSPAIVSPQLQAGGVSPVQQQQRRVSAAAGGGGGGRLQRPDLIDVISSPGTPSPGNAIMYME